MKKLVILVVLLLLASTANAITYTKLLYVSSTGFHNGWNPVNCGFTLSSRSDCVRDLNERTYFLDYMQSAGPGSQQSFHLERHGLSANAVIRALRVHYHHANVNRSGLPSCFSPLLRGLNSMRHRITHVTPITFCPYNDGNQIVGQSNSIAYRVNPITGRTWTTSELDSIEVGMILARRSSTNPLKIGALYAVVEYS